MNKMHIIIRNVPPIKIRFFVLTLILFTIYLFLYYIVLEAKFKSRSMATSSLSLPFVVVHLDLKGAPPKLDYLVNFFAYIKKLGANSVIIEYEDMFPFEGKLSNLSSKNCYDKAQLKNVLSTAVDSGLEIIPLVQTFGHMEYVLKLGQFQHLREDPIYVDSICPSNIESHVLIKDMLEQVITFHLSIAPLKYIHVGCDEVYQINKCQRCTERNLSNLDMYLWHLNRVRDIVTFMSAETTVLIWDDMLRPVPLPIWNKVDKNAFRKIEPVYWDYDSNVRVTHINLMKYHKKFSNIWVASAFKGADGKTAVVPNISRRFANHFSWLNLILGYKFGGEPNTFMFKGIILTGWSRYNHMEPICELLPVAIPSLTYNLLLVKKYKNTFIENIASYTLEEAYINIETDVKKYLNCNDPNISSNDVDKFHCSFCNFEGSELCKVLEQYMLASTNISTEIGYIGGVYTPQMNNKTYPILQHLVWRNYTYKQIIDLENNIAKAMYKYYDKHIITEYVTAKTMNMKNELYNLVSILRKQVVFFRDRM